MSALAVARPPTPDSGGITSKQTANTSSLTLGNGAFKKAIMANHARKGNDEFSYAGLQRAGGPLNADAGYYAIVEVKDFPASRLLSELRLQFDFAKLGLSPQIYALQIERNGATETYYGEQQILSVLELEGYHNEELDFLIAMERVNYNTDDLSIVYPAQVINQDPSKLIALIDNVLDKGLKLLVDINLRNLSTKCYGRLDSCELGVIDLDIEFVTDVALSWFTYGIPRKLAKQYMVLMVCFVGLANGLDRDTKISLLTKVKLLSKDGKFNTAAINKMLEYPALKSKIKHYLTSNYIDTVDVARDIEKDYVEDELFLDAEILLRLFNRVKSEIPGSSGGKSRRKHKKTSKRKPKSKKTYRKRSLLNHNLTR